MDTEKKRCTAIVLAAGSGKRMGSATAKQFMLLEGRPILWYSLKTIEESKIIDDCIIVTGAEDIEYVRREIVEKYDFRKVDAVTAGGRERWESVYHGLRVVVQGDRTELKGNGYVFIHDGARPFLTEEMLCNAYREVCRHRACAVAVPVKDTIKIADKDGFAVKTPDRRLLWAVQTPQVFETELIFRAYEKLCREGETISVTDDAMVIEQILGLPVKLVEGSYGNIKITTPEDMGAARSLLEGWLEGLEKNCENFKKYVDRNNSFC